MTQPAPAFSYIYRWNRHGRKGQPCAVTARSKRGKGLHNFNSIRVEFPDGFIIITSGNAIRRAPSTERTIHVAQEG